jgi:hypothetical protein
MNVSISFRPKLADVAHPGTAPEDVVGAPGTAPARKMILKEHAVLETGAPRAKKISKERADSVIGAPGAAKPFGW